MPCCATSSPASFRQEAPGRWRPAWTAAPCHRRVPERGARRQIGIARPRPSTAMRSCRTFEVMAVGGQIDIQPHAAEGRSRTHLAERDGVRRAAHVARDAKIGERVAHHRHRHHGDDANQRHDEQRFENREARLEDRRLRHSSSTAQGEYHAPGGKLFDENPDYSANYSQVFTIAWDCTWAVLVRGITLSTFCRIGYLKSNDHPPRSQAITKPRRTTKNDKSCLTKLRLKPRVQRLRWTSLIIAATLRPAAAKMVARLNSTRSNHSGRATNG